MFVAASVKCRICEKSVAFSRLILFDHYSIDHVSFARAVIIEMNVSARFDQVLVDLSAGFVEVANRLVEHESKSILRAFRADYD